MATIGDYIFLFIVVAIIAAIVYALRGKDINKGIEATKADLKSKGLNITPGGVSIKTNRRAPTREEYIDSTQRSFMKSGEIISKHREAFSWGSGGGSGSAEAAQKGKGSTKKK